MSLMEWSQVVAQSQAFRIETVDEVEAVVNGASSLTFYRSLPVALLLPPALTGGKKL